MKIGIVGLPNVGKSTLFKALTKKDVDISNYPFCTIDPNIGIVQVPDERLAVLTKISNSKKTISAVVEFYDIAGLVKGASEGEGLGNKFLSHIRETDAIVEVVRIFKDESVIHVHNKIDPLSDIEIINTELILADLETVKKHLEKIFKDAKRGDKKSILEKEIIEKFEKWLLGNNPAHKFSADDKEKEIIKELHLISSKPVIYVLNKKSGAENLEIGKDYFMGENFLRIDVNLELEMQSLKDEEKQEYREVSGSEENENLDELIKLSYKTLGLITFFTTGEDESRAWTIKDGSAAPEAGAAIHTDFKDKFIKAEVISFPDFVKVGAMSEARKRGLLRVEGKNYIVKDGDIIEFKI